MHDFFLHKTLNFTEVLLCDETLVSLIPPGPNCRGKCEKNAINVSQPRTVSLIAAHFPGSASLPYILPLCAAHGNRHVCTIFPVSAGQCTHQVSLMLREHQ